MQKYPNRWYYNLPIVTMVLRTTQKEDLHHSPAELVYGQDLRLPGEFKTKIKHEFFQRGTLAHSLKEFVKELKPVPTRVYAEKKSFLDKNLQDCKFVLVRNDAVLPPLSPRFSGSYEVVKRQEKYFVLKDPKTGTEKSVSIDRLKAYFVLPDQIQTSTNEADEEPPSSSSSEAKSKDESTKSKVRTRAGREVKPPDRFY